MLIMDSEKVPSFKVIVIGVKQAAFSTSRSPGRARKRSPPKAELLRRSKKNLWNGTFDFTKWQVSNRCNSCQSCRERRPHLEMSGKQLGGKNWCPSKQAPRYVRFECLANDAGGQRHRHADARCEPGGQFFQGVQVSGPHLWGICIETDVLLLCELTFLSWSFWVNFNITATGPFLASQCSVTCANSSNSSEGCLSQNHKLVANTTVGFVLESHQFLELTHPTCIATTKMMPGGWNLDRIHHRVQMKEGLSTFDSQQPRVRRTAGCFNTFGSWPCNKMLLTTALDYLHLAFVRGLEATLLSVFWLSPFGIVGRDYSKYRVVVTFPPCISCSVWKCTKIEPSW